MRRWGWRRITVVALLALLVLGCVAGGLAWWCAASRSRAERAFRERVSADWKGIAGRMNTLVDAMTRVANPGDLDAVEEGAGALAAGVAKVSNSLEKTRVPEKYREVAERERLALDSVGRYATVLGELSAGDDRAVADGRAALESLASRAQEAVTSFTGSAPWLSVKLPGDLYQGGSTLQSAFRHMDPAAEAAARVVHDTVEAFMDADIHRHDLDTVWSMLSSRLHTGFDYFKITKEKLMQGWNDAWGSNKPVGYYVSAAQIDFSDPDTANVKVIAYVENGDPRIEEVRLVREGDAWKIDAYPFVGWL